MAILVVQHVRTVVHGILEYVVDRADSLEKAALVLLIGAVMDMAAGIVGS